jgi:hypothetical protein
MKGQPYGKPSLDLSDIESEVICLAQKQPGPLLHKICIHDYKIT